MLSGRTIVVTGAARGVGRAIARGAAAARARLVLGDILEDGGRDAARELNKSTKARFVPVDLDDPAGARRGIFAFQLHAGGPFEVRYRKIELQLLSGDRIAAGAAK